MTDTTNKVTKTVGIDLGTTYSAISYYDEANHRVVTVELVNAADGAREIRSVVYYPAGGGVVVGDTACNAARQYPDRVVIGVKRSMGTSWSFKVDGRELSAAEISAEILKVLLQEAAAVLGEDIANLEAVITVPAYFGDGERTPTLEAGKLAGVKVLGLLSEPHAAALAYVVEVGENINDRDLLVYDLGGGTFDVTLIRSESVPIVGAAPGAPDRTLKLLTLRKEGNSALGGLDWDRELATLVADKAATLHNVDVLADPRNKAFLEESCEKAKRHLSRTESVTVPVDLQGHAVEVTRQEFEDCTKGLLFQTEALVEQVLLDAVPMFQDRARAAGSPDPSTVDLAYVKTNVDVMLTGGSSKMPMVEAMLRRVMGRPPLKYGNPHLLVSMGAAYYANLLQAGFKAQVEGLGPGAKKPASGPAPGPDSVPVAGSSPASDGPPAPPSGPSPFVIVEITRESVGVAALRVTGRDTSGNPTYEEIHAIVLPKGSPWGTPKVQEFAKAADGATEIEIALYKGESKNLKDCDLLKTFTIRDLPPTGRRGDLIDVTLEYDASGIVRATATDRASGKSASVEVTDRL